MGLDSLLAVVCAGLVMSGGPDMGANATVNEPQSTAIASTLAVQTALQRGRECLREGNYQGAVSALESQIAAINGSTVYLQELQRAYKGVIKELRLAGRDSDAQLYITRLAIIDRDGSMDSGPGRPGAPRVARPGPIVAAPAKPSPKIRLQAEEPAETNSLVGVRKNNPDLADLLSRADREFTQKHYEEARQLYEKVQALDPKALDPNGGGTSPERLAYCKLSRVVGELKKDLEQPELQELEKETRVALSLAPRLDYGKKVLAAIGQRRAVALAAPKVRPAGIQVALNHRQRNAEGWLVCESPSFLIYYKDGQEFADQAAQIAEAIRTSMQQKWFGGANREWSPRCAIYLHPTASDYSRATGQYNSPGHSSIRIENGRFVMRQIDLHCDDANLLTAILPHETTHIVLASELGEHQVERLPRWADEGVSVLTEPREKVERHFVNLSKARQDNQLFSLKELMEMPNYPQNPRQISTFYAESVSVVDFLTSLGGPQKFMLFLQDGMRYGYEKSLQRHFNIASFSELEGRWSTYMVGEQTMATRVAGR
jgi:tetratricopeptide (TPR) repeat protein